MGQVNSQRKIRNIFIHKKMQREFSLVLIGLLIAASFVISFLIHHTIHEAAFGGGAVQFGKVNPYQVISSVRYEIISRVTIVLFVTLIIIGSYGVKFLHRVAGPIYRCRKTLMALNEGELPAPIILREGDFFGEVAAEVNIQSDLWRQEREKMDWIRLKLDELTQAASTEEMSQKAAEIKDSLA